GCTGAERFGDQCAGTGDSRRTSWAGTVTEARECVEAGNRPPRGRRGGRDLTIRDQLSTGPQPPEVVQVASRRPQKMIRIVERSRRGGEVIQQATLTVDLDSLRARRRRDMELSCPGAEGAERDAGGARSAETARHRRWRRRWGWRAAR